MDLCMIKSSTHTFIAKPNKFVKPELVSCLPDKLEESSVRRSNKFLNCISLEFMLDKLIVCKIFRNGTLQLTGCKNLTQPIAVCRMIMVHLDCCYILYMAMENIYTDLGFGINKLQLYHKWRKVADASPPIGNYTAVRLRFTVDSGIHTEYMITGSTVVSFHKKFDIPTKVNIAVFHNGKVLLSGLNKVCLMAAFKFLQQIINENQEIKVAILDTFDEI